MAAKYVFVTGGVVSSLGKGLAAASIGCLLRESGGTVGDIESLPFLEAIRQMRQELGRYNTIFIHVTLVPWIGAAGELKTKTTQHSVKELLSIGIQPDVLLCRTDRFLSKELKSKIALFCNVEDEAVITAKDVASIYEVPLVFAREGVDTLVLRYLRMESKQPDLTRWEELMQRVYNPQDEVHIGIVGKYVEYEDSYKSLKEALVHGAVAHNLKLNLTWVEAEGLESKDGNRDYEMQLEGFDGILVPGGFGKRGIEGMLNGIRYAREKKVPYFGICLGMQTACIEFARNVCGLDEANSSEFDQATPHRIIYKLRELTGIDELGGTMRLGAWTCKLEPNSQAAKAYGSMEISERHRHRYEFNREYEAILTGGGLRITGATPDGTYVEIVEIPDNPYFLRRQFPPEFKSKPLEPHPLFREFIKASYRSEERRRESQRSEEHTSDLQSHSFIS